MSTTVIAIAVVAANGVIGDGRDQPFKFREDWQRFKRLTMGHPLVVGRTTHDAMGLLPGRTSIVVSHHPELVRWPLEQPEGSRGLAVGSVEGALALASTLDETVFVIGGGSVYRAAWPWIGALDITAVHRSAEGGVLFPAIDPQQWRETFREPGMRFDFVGYARREPARPLPGG
ncbi:dihydrofolate reductase [Propionibacterium cyclohexanicum]|uniref:dihydrofolate reductase n=1 Tax=Propionibacterium cyclohexanicum TaxID=64702 RepID=A0A1H9QCE1_9ACTN|nr:dihydrofolate reductase [Propionibacterium cyclohexanicum]SER58206.1 dihydrofolate reductase [Propionibacterium cyclohexanicum]